MGNKQLRPSQTEPLSGFNDDQISYLKDKFQILCDQSKLLSIQKIADAFKCSREEASKILNYIDFQNHGQVDFYEFTCAAATLHQDDEEAIQFLYELFGNGDQLDQNNFEALYGTIFRYLKFLDKIKQDYEPEMGEKKFIQYDYNKNSKIGFEQFKSMLKNDYHCRLWMEVLGFAQQQPNERPEKPLNQQNDQFLLDQQKGDQAGSTPSWIKTITYMAPQNAKPPADIDTPPTRQLQIQYVYGYRSYDTRDNLRYNSNGDVVYHTGGCGIVLNKAKNTMKVTTEHNDDITCLDINLNKNIVVTGEMGRRPSLVVWDSNTLQTKNVFKGKLEKSISCVAISKSGRYVAAASTSDTHEIGIFDLTKNAMISFGQGPKSVIYSIKFTSNEQQLVCACQKQVSFIKVTPGKLQTKRGIFGKAPLTANFCIGLLGDAIVTGMANGALGYWKGNSCSKVYKQHVKPVTAICERKDAGVISGDTQGTIIIWSSNLSKQRQIQLKKIFPNSNNPKIISLFQGYGNILVGTRGGQIIEVQQKNTSVNIVMQGHYDQQLWALTVSQNKHQFFTGGQDKLLIKWDSDKRKIIKKKKMEYGITSIDFNRNGLLAVGHTNGVVNLVDSDKFDHKKKIQTFKNPDKQVLSVVKFSPNGNILAVGYCPPVSQVYLYNVQDGKKIGQCKGSPSRILSIDFSRDGNSIIVNNTSYEILFYNTNTGAQITSATSFKGQQFATMTSRFSWYTQGIWPPCSDGSDINSVDRSNSKRYLVTADDFSKVKLFKYPVCKNKQISNSYKGHSSHVTNIKWQYDDKFVISTGGLEKSIIQWLFEENQQISYQYQEKNEQQAEQENQNQQYQFEAQQVEQKKQKGQEGQFQLEEDSGDQSLAVKPFQGQVRASTPNSFKTMSRKNELPQQDLQIQHVWGIRNQYINDRVRNQLRYTSNFNSCVFITAALGVQMDLKTKKQQFYQGHAQDLVSFAMTTDRKYCATGQMAQINKKQLKSKIVDIHVWDTQNKQKKAKLAGFHQRAIVLLQFSPSGKKLLTVGQDDKNSLAVYDWQINRIAWSSPVCGAKVTGGAWKNQNQFMTVGFKHVKIWTNNKGMMCKIAGKWDPMVSVVSWNDKYVSGGSQGALYLWTGTTSVSTKGHEGSVDSLRVDPKGVLYSGCSAGKINKWKYSGGKLVIDQKVINMAEIDTFSPGILSIDFSPDNILVCTNSSSIYEIPKSGKQKVNIVMQSHYQIQLWAEAWSPNSKQFVTGGDDKTIRIYDASTFQMLHSYKMKQRVRGIDWQRTKGQLIVVGCNKGRIYLFDSTLKLLDEAKTKISKTKPRQQPYWIEDIKFSPNGQHVAFGSHGGITYIQIYEIKDGKFGKETIIPNLITSAALSVDWSQDSSNLAIVSQAYQLQFTNLTAKVSASSVRQIKWASWTGKFGAYVQQIHQDVDYSNLNAVDISPTGSLIATGGDDQKIKLFRSPAIIPKQKHKQFVGHSSHVTKVRFSRDQRFLLSTGGNDRTIILWKLVGIQEQDNQQNQGQNVEQNQQNEDDEGNQDASQIQIPKIKEQVKKKEQPKKVLDQGQFNLQQQEGDQFMAVKPWLGAIKQPTKSYYKGTGKAPKAQLILQYAHGYRSKDCRNNLIYLSDNRIAYHTAGLGVIMDIEKLPRQQTFFNMHTDDIISMCWSQDKTSLFTGQMGAKPIIYQWNNNGEMIQKYRGAKKSISAIGVNGRYLASASMDDDHYINVFELGSQKPICTQKGGRQFITALKWLDAQNFVTIGIKHYKVWTLSNKTIKAKTGLFGKNCNILCCLVIKDSNIYVGASDGSLQVWSGNSCSKSIKIHEKSLNALTIVNDVILTGSKDQSICILQSSSLNKLATINCKTLLTESVCKQIQALDVFENKIILGTKGSQIYQIKCNKNIDSSIDQSSQFRLIGQHMSGHFAPNHVTNEVWGIAVYDNSYYLSCSDDGTLRAWDIQKKQQVICCNLDISEKLKPRVRKAGQKFLPKSCKGNSISVAKTGQIIVGCKDGRIIVLDNRFRPILVQQITDKQISVVKLSPDESVLGVGDHIGKIILLNWNQATSKLTIKNSKIKHSSAIKNFDFSRDSNIIHSTCSSYQLLFWDVNTGKQITAGATSTRDEDWATWSLSLGWPVQGVFEQFMDGTDINAVDRSKRTYGQKGMRLLGTADDRGHVRLLQYPCLVKNSQSIVGKGHSSHVTGILFSNDDKYIFSTGGQDQTVLQWLVQA